MTSILIKGIPEHLKKALKVQAAKEGRTMTAILIECIISYLEARR